MNANNGLKTTYSALSFQFLLEEIIMWAVRKVAIEIAGTADISSLTAAPKVMPLRKIQEATLITYQTAIALNLSHQWNKPVNDVAEHIALQMSRITHEGSEGGSDVRPVALEKEPLPTFTTAIGRTLTLSIHPKGYVQCHLSVETLNIWLQAILQANNRYRRPDDISNRVHLEHGSHPSCAMGTTPGLLSHSPITQNAPRRDSQWAIADIPFAVFHAHARCCSILRLAHTTGQITLQSWQKIDPVSTPTSVLRPPWIILHPTSLSWQTILSPQRSPQARAIADPLLIQIITSLDQFVPLTTDASRSTQNRSTQKRNAKLLNGIIDLSTAIHRFDANIAFQGKDLSRGQRDTHAQGVPQPPTSEYVPYLGLILIAQSVLNVLLTDFLERTNIYLEIPDEL